jgi:hypothetical protein
MRYKFINNVHSEYEFELVENHPINGKNLCMYKVYEKKTGNLFDTLPFTCSSFVPIEPLPIKSPEDWL